MERIALPEVSAVFICNGCGWKEAAETVVHRINGLECPRCNRDGMEVVIEREQITELKQFKWCNACRTWHST